MAFEYKKRWISHLRDPTEECPLNVLIVHGDPTKPNRILPGGKWDADDFETIELLKEALATLNCYRFEFLCNHDTMIQELQRRWSAEEFDIVLQFCDEGWQNDPRMEIHVTALLELLGIPFTGSGAHALAISYDKDMVLQLVKSIGVPSPCSCMLLEGRELDHDLPYPVFVKPNNTDGSFGITEKSICHNADELCAAVRMIRDTFRVHGPVLVQEYLPGKDVTVSMIGNPPADPSVQLPIIEEDYSEVPSSLPRILGFESKWIESSPYWKIRSVPTSLSADVQQQMLEQSYAAFQRLGYRDYCRFDWRLDADGQPRLLEINPNCGWCADGHLAKTCAVAGISYARMLDLMLRAAVRRYQRLATQLQREREQAADIETIMRDVAKQIAASSTSSPSSLSPSSASSSNVESP